MLFRSEPEEFAFRLRNYLTEYTDFPADYDPEKFAFAADLVQTRIDLRAASRYGRHDFGANARRILAFAEGLQTQLDAK